MVDGFYLLNQFKANESIKSNYIQFYIISVDTYFIIKQQLIPIDKIILEDVTIEYISKILKYLESKHNLPITFKIL